MPLWTDLITPIEATGFARVELEDRERAKGSLSRFLPNVFSPSRYISFKVGDHGLVDEALYRELDARPEIGRGEKVQTRAIRLPNISRNEPIDEQTQDNLKYVSDDVLRKSIIQTIRRTVWSICDRQERVRGSVIHAGKAISEQHNYSLNDDFGRDAALQFTAPQLWSDPSTDRLQQLADWVDLYAQKNNGTEPGTILMSRAAFAALCRGGQFRQVQPGGATLPAGNQAVLQYLDGQGLPPVEQYNRSTKSGLVLPKEYIYFLPAPVDPFSEEPSPLGATYWGDTVTATLPEFGLEPAETSGIVVGVHRNDRIPATIEVEADSTGEPVAADANKAMAVKVL